MTGGRPPANYTTKIPAKRTIGECQDLLAEAGADAVAIMFEARQPVGLSFRLDTPAGRQDFLMPINVEGIASMLRNAAYPPSAKTAEISRYVTREHAVRVAWRTIQDWLEAQLALIAAGMARLDEVMLPYLQIEPGRTLREVILTDRRMPQLTEGRR
jgi:hypothetical protein